ncbi:hypothetical protein KIW84_044075 [Lathyrus oleraceus]|uniref:superoxide dismutase n=1 Tax=Pisum sativum TaxID=3888 RepID=A0A9D4XGY1_PEA|nr:hypothetical protein KIW84_044075 [Pisum sativum]
MINQYFCNENSQDALEPFMSQDTFEYHWGKHHRAYVDNLNKQIDETDLDGKSPEETIVIAYNNGDILPAFMFLIHVSEPQFKLAAATQFGSGWAWLACVTWNMYCGNCLDECLGTFCLIHWRKAMNFVEFEPLQDNRSFEFSSVDVTVEMAYKCRAIYIVEAVARFIKDILLFVLQGENISDLESESESESEFLILGPSLPRTPISVPSLEPEFSPSLSLSPSSTPESEPVSVPGPSRPSVLQESAPLAPTLVYQRRSKPDLLQKQIQSPELEVSTENDSSSDDCAISDTCDTNPVDLSIALRKDKRSCPSLYRHPISQYVSTKHLSTQYQSFIAAVDSVKIPSSVEEALQNRN